MHKVETIPTELAKWLEMTASKDSTPPEGRGWWILPSPARPRVYFPCTPSAWGNALELIHSPLRSKATLVLLWLMHLCRIPPHRTAPSNCPMDEWLEIHFPRAGPFTYAVYSGTPNLFVKDTLQCMDREGNILAYARMPRGARAAEVVENERISILGLQERFPDDPFFPHIIDSKDRVTLQTPPPSGAKFAASVKECGLLLEKLAETHNRSIPWLESPVRSTLAQGIETLKSVGASDWAKTVATALEESDRLWHGIEMVHVFSHGDFIPWNLRTGPFAFDWEWAAQRMQWHDAFHYLWMPLILKADVSPDSLWDVWTGAEGNQIRLGKPAGNGDLLLAFSYLAWQFSFYAGASAQNGDELQTSRLLQTLHSLLIAFLPAAIPSPSL